MVPVVQLVALMQAVRLAQLVVLMVVLAPTMLKAQVMQLVVLMVQQAALMAQLVLAVPRVPSRSFRL